MARYYVNKNAQSTGEHEVHKAGCPVMPQAQNLISLGEFSNCKEAVAAARNHYSNVDGCGVCSKDCHTR